MGFRYNTLLFVVLCLLTSLINHIFICKASDEVLCIPSERQALLNFKHHLVDPSNRLSSWSENTNCCKWISVVCNNVSGHILQLHLNSASLSDYGEIETFESFGGEIDPSICALDYLRYLDLSGNYFLGMQIPSFLGSMRSLTYLNLSHAGFRGGIPHQIANLSSLVYLDLGGNHFTGKIPHQIGNLSNLLYLSLYGGYRYDDMVGIQMLMDVENLQWMSSLSSLQYLKLGMANLSNSFAWFHILQSLPSLTELHLPSCAFPYHHFPSAISINFSSLVVLDVSHNCYDFCSYFIPKWISRLKNLVSLQLNGIDLEGSIPNGIQNFTLLKDLDLSFNLFNSSIPDWLYTLTHLKSLSLSWSNLQGPISHAIGNLTSLVTLDLSSSHLEGPIPISLSSLCNLRRVDFSNIKLNQQVSKIIEIISNCASHTLQDLSISSAQLSGHLTPRVGIFKNLMSLHLQNNSIDGAIPISLGNSSSLNNLDLSQNQLNGNPFDAIQSLSALQSLDISDNIFQGEVTEDHLSNLTELYDFLASGNKLILKVGRNWKPSFQKLNYLDMTSWNLGPHFPSWIQSLQRLQSLSIANSNISDSLPMWVWDAFPYAFFFDFSNNNIHGDLSHTIKNAINVSYIYLSSNRLTGPLPYISPNVNELVLSNNLFSGLLDSFLCQGKVKQMELEHLNLESNKLSGEIPDCWMMWPNINTVKFDNNHFSGNLPQSLGSLSWLGSLQLRNNALLGKFPICLKNNTRLIFLDLSDNELSGISPLWVGQDLLNLKVFLLRSNKFIGNIPNQICCLNSLQMLDLAQNNLTGQIPKCINNLTAMLIKNNSLDSKILNIANKTPYVIRDVLLALKGRVDDYAFPGLIMSIDLSDNELSGDIPHQITSLAGLQFLNLSNNLLTGKIPQSIGNMGSLQSIEFSDNKIYGEIPPSISKLNFLSKLNLSHNNLTGKIPTGTQLQSFEANNFVGNDLCGPPLPDNCSDPHIVPKHGHNAKEGRGGINWFYVSIALGFVLGFWGVVCPLLYSRLWRYTYFSLIDRMWYRLRSLWW